MKITIRHALQRVLRVLSAGAVTILFQACYGSFPAEDTHFLLGKVTDADNKPIKDINVLVETWGTFCRTDEDGEFSLSVGLNETLDLTFVDSDGPENGGEFETTSVPVTTPYSFDTYRIDDVKLKAKQ